MNIYVRMHDVYSIHLLINEYSGQKRKTLTWELLMRAPSHSNARSKDTKWEKGFIQRRRTTTTILHALPCFAVPSLR